MQIPTISFASRDATRLANLEAALADTGFMLLSDTGIEVAQISAVFEASRSFFQCSDEFKQRFRYHGATDNFGYQSVGMESLDPDRPPDLKEALTVRNPSARRDADWPSAGLRDLILDFYQRCLVVAHKLQGDTATVLDLPRDYFHSRITGENVTLRLLHYPPLAARESGQLGAGAHTDYGLQTLLFQDQVGGLEVLGQQSDTWIPVAPRAGEIVVNTGDLMERWTNGRFRSTCHRVQPQTGTGDRYSLALFLDPDDTVEVSCLPSCVSARNPARYPPTTAGEHILAKLRASHR